MAKYICLADGSWTTPSESAGSIQCQSGSIEVCAINTDNTGIKIGQGDMIAFSGTVYVRSTNKKQAIFTAVPFDVKGGEEVVAVAHLIPSQQLLLLSKVV